MSNYPANVIVVHFHKERVGMQCRMWCGAWVPDTGDVARSTVYLSRVTCEDCRKAYRRDDQAEPV